MQLIVLGMHRSGTSAIARILNMMGAYFAQEGMAMKAGPDNPKGFWERTDVYKLNDEILAAGHAKWDQIISFDSAFCSEAGYKDFGNRIRDIVLDLDAHRPWMLKDPRLCYVFPLWRRYLEVPIIIYAHRNPIQVAKSLQERNGFPLLQGLALWEHYAVSAINATIGLPRILINYEELMSNPMRVVSELYAQLNDLGVANLRLPQEKELLAFLDNSLQHHKGGQENYQDFMIGSQAALAASLDGGFFPGNSEPMRISKGATELLATLGEMRSAIDSLRREIEQRKDDNGAEISGLNNIILRHEQTISGLNNIILRHEQTISELHKNVEILQDENQIFIEKINAANQEIGKIVTQLDVAKCDLALSLEKNDSLQVDVDRFQQQIKSYEKNAAETEHVFWEQREQISQQNSWLAELDRDILAIFSSMRWKTGSSIFKLLDIILFRFNRPTAQQHINEILDEYRKFSFTRNASSSFSSGEKQPSFSEPRKSSIATLLCAIISHPVLTFRLLSPNRIKNFCVTIFRQPDNIRESIISYYLQLYNVRQGPQHCGTEGKPIFSSQDEKIVFPRYDSPLVSIIVPVYNQFDTTMNCLRSIADNTRGIPYEVILADDCSTDNTLIISEFTKNLKIVRSVQNKGFLKNCNHAAQAAKGVYIYFLNNDTKVTQDWLPPLVEILKNDTKVGMVGSKLVYPDGRLQEAGGIIWDDASGWNFGRLDDPSKPEYNYVKEVDYISGACIMIRKFLWEEIGGFDERYAPAYFEDADLAFEVRDKGFKVVYTPFSVVIHFEGQSHGTDESSGIKKYQAINRGKFIDKWSSVLKLEHFPNGKNVFLARDRSRVKKTLLMVDHYVPHFDQDAGSKTIFQYLQLLVSNNFNVKFIGDNFAKLEPYTSALQKMGIEVLDGPWYATNWKTWFNDNSKYIDYVFLNRPHISINYIDFVRQNSSAKILYYGHDLHFLREQRRYELEKDQKLFPEIERWKKIELDICKKVDVVLYPSSVEIDEIKKILPTISAYAIPAYIFDRQDKERNPVENTSDLMFVGGFGHPPNADAVEWFVQNVFPRILEVMPGIKFYIIGSKPPEHIKRLASKNIIVTGFISEEELSKYYRSIRLAVAPLQYGAGVKGKVVEAIYNKIPMVTTSVGAEGLPDAGTVLWIEDDPIAFAKKLVDLYEDKGTIGNYSRVAEAYIANNFSPSSAKQVLQQFIEIN